MVMFVDMVDRKVLLEIGVIVTVSLATEVMMRKRSYYCLKSRNILAFRPRAHESGSVWVWSQTGADRPCVHTRPPLSDPVWVCYPY